MVVFNIVFMLVVYLGVRDERSQLIQVVTMLLEQRQQTIEMMARLPAPNGK